MTATHEAFITQLSAYRTHTTLGTKKADALSAKLSGIRLKLAKQSLLQYLSKETRRE